MTDEEEDLDEDDDGDEGDDEENDEEEFWGCKLPTPESGWALVANSFDGAESWEPPFEVLRDL